MISEQVRKHIIRPVLRDIGLNSKDAEELLMLTAAQESHMGKYIKQLGGGPALGIFQMENATHDDIWSNYLKYKSELANHIGRWDLVGSFPYDNAYQMCGNHYYAAAMCRVHYLRVKEPLPKYDDIEGLAKYWKKYYNTYLGAGTVEEAIENYYKYAK